MATSPLHHPVLGFSQRNGPGRYQIRLEPPVTAQGHGALLALAATLERYVRAHPEQWFVFEPMWDEPCAEALGTSA